VKFYISDTHFGHENIIKHANRPFESVLEMDEAMVQNWNSVVKSGDLVYHVGDFCWNKPKQYRERLNGNIILILGNHDKRLTTGEKTKFFEQVYDYKKIKDNGHSIVLFHYPIWSWDGLYRGTHHFYGHVHGHKGPRSQGGEVNIEGNKKGKMINVSVEKINYTPRTIEELISGSYKR